MPNNSVKVFIMSWNMGNAEQVGMKNVLDERDATADYDIIVIGLQESTYAIKGQQAADSIAHLGKQIQDMVGEKYYLVERCQRAQLQLIVYARLELRHSISNIEMQIENTGILHVFPNKGGLLLTFNVHGTRLAFISCHLTAHEGVKHCEDRNASIVEILRGVRAGDKRIDITEQFHHIFWMGDMNYRTTFDTATPANTKKNIVTLHAALEKNSQAVDAPTSSTDVGLNFGDDDGDESEEDAEDAHNRTERESHMKRVMDMISKKQFEDILRFDELNREISAKRVLNEFVALQPNFAPTFKRARNQVLDLGTARRCSLPAATETQPGSLTTSSALSTSTSSLGAGTPTPLASPRKDKEHPLQPYYNHKRMPSYTDRILYKTLPTFQQDVQNLFFESCEAATSSDHKPVRAGFEIRIHKGVEELLVDKTLATKRSNETRTMKLCITNLRGYDLEEMDSQLFGGLSDPYIVFTTDPAHLLMHRGKLTPHLGAENLGVKTSVVKHNINPVWPDVIDLEIASIDVEKLSSCASLLLAVWDEDRMNAHDLIGVLTIPFRTILADFARHAGVYSFDDVVRYSSEVMGRISGTITLRGSFQELMEWNQAVLEPDRYTNQQHIPLHAALEATNQSADCRCVLH